MKRSSGRAIRCLAKYHDSKRFRFQVYSTEAQVRREKQQFTPGPMIAPSAKRGKDTLDLLTKQKIATWISPTDGDVVSAAKDLAGQLVRGSH